MLDEEPASNIRMIGHVAASRGVDALARSLRDEILANDWPQGHPLPTERQLSEQSGLSRGSVREALRVLEAQGLLEVRAGRSGGNFVRRPDASALRSGLGLFVHGQQISLQALVTTREIVEPGLAELAAANRTPDDLHHLELALDRMRQARNDKLRFLEANVAWHCAVADASGNLLLSTFIKSISDLIHQGTAIEAADTDEARDVVIAAHQRIQAAIVERNGPAARRRMARHVVSHSRAVAETGDAELYVRKEGLK